MITIIFAALPPLELTLEQNAGSRSWGITLINDAKLRPVVKSIIAGSPPPRVASPEPHSGNLFTRVRPPQASLGPRWIWSRGTSSR